MIWYKTNDQLFRGMGIFCVNRLFGDAIKSRLYIICLQSYHYICLQANLQGLILYN